MSDLQLRVQQAIGRLVESGAETGVQVAVYRRGELVVDAVAGVADVDTGRPMDSGVPIFSTSTGKGLTSTVVHVLVERGVLGYETPVVELWPEYGANGKQATTVRHVLTHAAGVPGLPADVTPEDLADWPKMCAALAEAEPWWEPGTQFGYHAMTYGYLVGEIVRRATGKPISQVVREEIAAPLGVADELFFGVPQDQLSRVAPLVPGGPPLDDEMIKQLEEMMPLFFKVAPLAVQPSAELFNRTDFMTADVPAGATCSARAIARMYAALLDEVDGVRLISPQRLREISAVAVEGVDQVFGNLGKLTLGYSTSRPGQDSNRAAARIGWSGANGSHADADISTGVAFALTKNRFTGGDFTTATEIAELVTAAF